MRASCPSASSRHAGRHEQTYESRVRAERHPDKWAGGAASPAVTIPIPLLRASLSFLVKQPGGLGYKLHSKCSKCPVLLSSLAQRSFRATRLSA